MQVLEYIKSNQFTTETIMITGVGSVESAVHAIKLGAYDYLTKPFDDIQKVVLIISKALERYRLLQKIRHLEKQSDDKFAYEGIVGKSRKIQDVFNTIDNIAATTSTVLISGESGTGKELVARAIHRKSARKSKPFVIINCAALSEHLLESELFGHKKGSFTGAIQDKKGLFEEADKGTIFLDEIGEIPPSTQVKLLRVLQDGEMKSVGGNQSKIVDVRLIAATNKNLQVMVKEGTFREDLYYRLNVITLVLPALRERSEDITLLTYHFLEKYNRKINKSVNKISVDALQALQSYKWEGNVRELENVIERAVVLVKGDEVTARDLPSNVLGDSFYLVEGIADNDLSQYPYHDAKDKAMIVFNKSYLANLLRQCKGNISAAASKAGMDRSNFKKILKKYEVDVGEIKVEAHQ
ncbi:sigma-54 dependent transcriptional regulator, partial [bacterium]|nr:sigma-54 dependent transcriptional regulator [bacterium]